MTVPGRKVNPSWNNLDWIGAAAILIFVIWVAIPSSLFLKPESVAVSEDGQVVFVRSLPLGRVTARWTIKIRVIYSDGHVCVNSGETVYTQEDDNTVVYNFGEWADRCLEQGPPLNVIFTRQVLLLGIIPLRPTTQEADILPEPVNIIINKRDR